MKKQNLKSKISNMKGSKGITLVALIITIIVLLILAVVAISSVNNTGIVQYAQNSKVAYIDGRDEEDTTLQNYMDILNHYKPEEEILWAYIEEDKELYFIGKVEELDLSQDKEIEAYISSYNAETEKIEYGEINTIKLSDACYIDCFGGNVQTLKIGILGLVDTDALEINLDGFSPQNVVIVEGITSIPYNSFEGDYMKSIILPSSLISIEHGTFNSLTNLTSITIKKAEGTLDLSNSGLTQEQIDNIVWAPEGE